MADEQTQLTEELSKLIQKAALDGALTEQAVAQFNGIVEENKNLTTRHEGLTREAAQLKRDNGQFESRVRILEKECETWAGREQDLLTREAECTKLEVEKACAEQRVADHKEMFTTVFRNSVLRKEVMTPTHPSAPDQYGTRTEGYPSKDTTEQEET